MRVTLTDRGLLRAMLLAFALLLAYQFLAAVVATVLLLATGLLLAVVLSAPVELLHRLEVPRPLAVGLIVLAVLTVLGLAGYLLFPVLVQKIESNLLTPLVMQRAVSLHPVVVIASVTVAGAAFGILGALLEVPISVVAGVLVDELWFRRLEEEEVSESSG